MKHTATIKSNSDFARVYKKGKYYAGRHLVLHVLKGSFGGSGSGSGAGEGAGTGAGEGGSPEEAAKSSALGIAISKKAGNSVRRNRLKRLIKENYRQFEGQVRGGYLLVFTSRAKQEGPPPDFYDIGREMGHLLARAGACDRPQRPKQPQDTQQPQPQPQPQPKQPQPQPQPQPPQHP